MAGRSLHDRGKGKKNLWAWKISSPACPARPFGGWKIIFRGGINTDDVLIYVHSLCSINNRTGTDTINSLHNYIIVHSQFFVIWDLQVGCVTPGNYLNWLVKTQQVKNTLFHSADQKLHHQSYNRYKWLFWVQQIKRSITLYWYQCISPNNSRIPLKTSCNKLA